MPRGHRKTDPLAPKPNTPLRTKSAQDAQALMSSVTAIKPEWQDAGQAISTLYLQYRQDKPSGRLAILSDPDIMASVLAGIDAGSTPAQAALAIGLADQTVIDHITQGEKDVRAGLETPHALFATQCQKAKERRRQRLLGRIEAAGQAGPQFWTAPAWLLERGYGQDYKIQQDRGSGNVVVQIGVSLKDLRIEGESPDPTPSVSHPANLPIIDIPSKS